MMNGAFSFSGATATRTREKSGATSHGPDGVNNVTDLPKDIDFPESVTGTATNPSLEM
jgi:hypothetical protein